MKIYLFISLCGFTEHVGFTNNFVFKIVIVSGNSNVAVHVIICLNVILECHKRCEIQLSRIQYRLVLLYCCFRCDRLKEVSIFRHVVFAEVNFIERSYNILIWIKYLGTLEEDRTDSSSEQQQKKQEAVY